MKDAVILLTNTFSFKAICLKSGTYSATAQNLHVSVFTVSFKTKLFKNNKKPKPPHKTQTKQPPRTNQRSLNGSKTSLNITLFPREPSPERF